MAYRYLHSGRGRGISVIHQNDMIKNLRRFVPASMRE